MAKPISPTVVMEILCGLRSYSITMAKRVVEAVEAEPHLYLTNGEACRGFSEIKRIVNGEDLGDE